MDSEDSLEATIRKHNSSRMLPVFTIGSTSKIFTNREYAAKVAERVLELLWDIENYRGAGRIFVP